MGFTNPQAGVGPSIHVKKGVFDAHMSCKEPFVRQGAFRPAAFGTDRALKCCRSLPRPNLPNQTWITYEQIKLNKSSSCRRRPNHVLCQQVWA